MIVPTSWSRNRNDVTTPKLPPPPRIAQIQVRVFVGARGHALAAGEHYLRLEQVVDREAALAGQMPEPAAERQTADAGGRDDAARRGETVLAGCRVHLTPRASAADSYRARLGIDLDVLQQREVDHHAVVDSAQPGAVVAATADCQRQLPVAREGNHLRDVVRVGDARDQGGTPVDHRVVDLARLLVGGVVGADHLAGELAPELPAGSVGCRRSCAHSVSFVGGPLAQRRESGRNSCAVRCASAAAPRLVARTSRSDPCGSRRSGAPRAPPTLGPRA